MVLACAAVVAAEDGRADVEAAVLDVGVAASDVWAVSTVWPSVWLTEKLAPPMVRR